MTSRCLLHLCKDFCSPARPPGLYPADSETQHTLIGHIATLAHGKALRQGSVHVPEGGGGGEVGWDDSGICWLACATLMSFILDIGAKSCRAGPDGNAQPSVSVKLPEFVSGSMLDRSGRVQDWAEYENIVEHLMRVGSSEWGSKAAIVSSGGMPWWGMAEAEAHEYFNNLAQMLLESQQFAGFTIIPSLVALAGRHGETNAVVADIGAEESRLGLVHQGKLLEHSLTRLPIGGYHVATKMHTLLQRRPETASIPLNAAVAAAEAHALVAQDIGRACSHLLKAGTVAQVNLGEENAGCTLDRRRVPGTQHTVLSERILAPEVLFCPGLGEAHHCSLEELAPLSGITDKGGIVSAAFKVSHMSHSCSDGDAEEHVRSFVLGGGAALLPGLNGRVCKEWSAISSDLPPATCTPPVAAGEGAVDSSAWVGAAMYLSHDRSDAFFVDQAKYDEEGMFARAVVALSFLVLTRARTKLPPLTLLIFRTILSKLPHAYSTAILAALCKASICTLCRFDCRL